MCLCPWVEPEEGVQWFLVQLPGISLRQVLSLNLGLMFSVFLARLEVSKP